MFSVIDNDYDPSMLDIDDEQTLDDEEALSNDSCNEIDDLQKVSSVYINFVKILMFLIYL